MTRLSIQRFKRSKPHILGGLVLIAILIWIAVFAQEKNQFLEIDFFDVGQGDAIFIEASNGNQVLIDGGPDKSILYALGKELPFYDRTIDLLILTHPDADHLTGLVEVLKNYDVRRILTSGVSHDSQKFQEWKRLIEEKNIPLGIAQAGKTIKLASNIVIDVLYPFESLEGKKVKNTNNASIVLRLIHKEDSFLFTGDAEKAVEYQLIRRGVYLDSDVLKVSHHGSKGSTGKDFVEAVAPEIAVIQVGRRNRYGHPHQEVLDILSGIKIYRTDLDGDVEMVSSGDGIVVTE